MSALKVRQKHAPIPFEAFAGFERIKGVNPIIACDPPEWAAAAPCLNRGLNGLHRFRGLPLTSLPPLYRSHPLCPSHALSP